MYVKMLNKKKFNISRIINKKNWELIKGNSFFSPLIILKQKIEIENVRIFCVLLRQHSILRDICFFQCT